ncbi:DUF6895 family protein [Streptomyces profundus]|uniref:DUF6895 family protein n=1 Tax=Streptomyces profundus TaxID=2867410 RepID=UPI001D1633A1|nr:hypothetical protein [Streptomyces sp. MA3_2.13]UED85106.1 hypothetical protein K4G22_13615 [Streptomyces sp. MA3_2.13]
MDTRSADTDEAVARLSAGARQWLVLHAGYLDSAAGRAELPLTPRVKALLQLALLRHYWARTEPADDGLREVTGIVEQAWRRPDFPHADRLDPRYARQLWLAYAALAPAGGRAEPYRGLLARFSAEGYLTPRRKMPYLQLETRYYADLAGAAHQLPSYQELYARSLLARCDDLPAASLDVCEITHTVLYLSDFGFRDPGLTGGEVERARNTVRQLLELSVRRGTWDYAAKLLLAQHCLGQRPASTAAGRAGIEMLTRARTAHGAIPGRTADTRSTPAATAQQRFRNSYQPTLGTALSTLLITAGRAGALTGAPAERGQR